MSYLYKKVFDKEILFSTSLSNFTDCF